MATPQRIEGQDRINDIRIIPPIPGSAFVSAEATLIRYPNAPSPLAFGHE
jgi:hypothetical protein